jgi:PAS domain S-box-containing protein
MSHNMKSPGGPRSDAPAVPPELAGQILEGSLNGICAFDPDLRITLWNRRMEQIFATPAGDVLGRPIFDCFPYLERSEGAAVRNVLLGVPSPERRPFPSPPGSRAAFYESHCTAIRRQDGQVAGAFLVIRDVTEQRRTEEMLEESESRFRIMADGAPVLLWMAGRDSDCTFFNQGWLEFTGRTLEMEYGTGWSGGVHPEDFQHCMTVYMNAFVERRDFRMEYRLRRADGQYRWILDTGRPRFAPDGNFEGYIGSCIDITDIRESASAQLRLNDELEARVERRTAELKQANAELESFSYSVSHDLRAPLRAIDGFSNILQELHAKSLDESGRHYLDRICSGAERMGDLIDDLLNLAKLTRTEVKPARVDLGDLSRTVVSELRKTQPDRIVDVQIASGL